MIDELSFLGSPYTGLFQPDDELQDKIARYFVSVLGCKKQEAISQLPKTMARHGKVHIAAKGDTIHCANKSTHRDRHDASHVQVCS